MADMDEMIDFIRSLKRGFDKDIFMCKLNELSDVVESVGLDNNYFHTLFKLWLNLSIREYIFHFWIYWLLLCWESFTINILFFVIKAITKWTSFGACLVPQGMVEERTVDYAFRWLIAGCKNGNLSRTAFLLDWITGKLT